MDRDLGIHGCNRMEFGHIDFACLDLDGVHQVGKPREEVDNAVERRSKG